MSDISENSKNHFDGGMLELPAELRAGAIHQTSYRELGEDEFGKHEAYARVVIRIVGLETVETPAGVFDAALRVETHTQGMSIEKDAHDSFIYTTRETQWFAKGLGMIKAVSRSAGEAQDFVLMEIQR